MKSALAQLTFGGGRFTGTGFPLSCAPELAAFQDLVREAARWLYRLDHPQARRVPNAFDESLGLRAVAIDRGSAVLPLVPELAPGGAPEIVEGLSYLERGVSIVTAAGAAANEDQPLPQQFPRSALAIVERFGASLAEDEWIDIQADSQSYCRYTSSTRAKLLRHGSTAYEDTVDVEGTVTGADVRRGVFWLTLAPERPELEARYEPAQEAEILDALRLHAERRVRVRGRGHFSSRGVLQRIEMAALVGEAEAGSESIRPIWEELLQLAKQVPPEEQGKIPEDLAEDPDRYLYGTRRA